MAALVHATVRAFLQRRRPHTQLRDWAHPKKNPPSSTPTPPPTMLRHCTPSLIYRMPARVAVAGVAYLRSRISNMSFMWPSTRMRSLEGRVSRRLSSITLRAEEQCVWAGGNQVGSRQALPVPARTSSCAPARLLALQAACCARHLSCPIPRSPIHGLNPVGIQVTIQQDPFGVVIRDVGQLAHAVGQQAILYAVEREQGVGAGGRVWGAAGPCAAIQTAETPQAALLPSFLLAAQV